VSQKQKNQKTIKLSISISIILSIALIILILFLTIDKETFAYLSLIRYEFFLAAIGLNVLYWILWGARLKVLANALDDQVDIGFMESTKIIIANLFLAGITPSMAGGEPVRIHLLNKDGLSLGSATASVLGERLLDAIFILICVPFAFFVFQEYITIGFIRTGLLIGVILFIVLILLFAYTLRYPDKTKSFLIFLNTKIRKLLKKDKGQSALINRVNTEVDNFHSSMVFFLREGKKAFCTAGILTVLYWSTAFMIPPMILMGLGLNPFFIESYAAQVLLLVIIMIPTTPGSSGVTELGVGGLYGVLLGDSYSYLLGVFVLVFRLITYHMNLICGAIFQYRIFKSVASFSLNSLKKQKNSL
jgi:hypothetical protein